MEAINSGVGKLALILKVTKRKKSNRAIESVQKVVFASF